ncbi:MAG TPA: hypothetical protein VGS02_17970 [Acidobacteriaceae bacterium]|nr:hypothetical protein [Acidobacteriaceae bacterium]
MKMRLALYPLLAMGAILVAGANLAAQNADSAKITTLLQHAREHAATANADAEQIDAYTLSRTDWRLHSDRINIMKENFNELAKDVGELTAAREEASPWQKEAIDDINPLLRSLADHMTAMINHLNDNPNRVHMPAYVSYAKANYELSQKLLAMINDYVGYAEAKARAEDLEQKLALTAEPSSGQE